jgi:predicted nucleic-acid-binding protein
MDKPEEVKRHLFYKGEGYCGQSDGGEFVKYSDYQALESKLKEAEQSFKSLAEHSEAKGKDFIALEAKVKELEEWKQGKKGIEDYYTVKETLAAANAKIVELEDKHEIELNRAYMIGQGSAHTGKYYSKDEFLKMCKEGFK